MSLLAKMMDLSRASDTSNVAAIVVFSFGRSDARLETFRSSIWATRTWRSCEVLLGMENGSETVILTTTFGSLFSNDHTVDQTNFTIATLSKRKCKHTQAYMICHAFLDP
jgi:hypothetical protein